MFKPTPGKIWKLCANIIRVNQYNIKPSQEKKISKILAKYFIKNSDFFLTEFENNQLVGLLMANLGNKKHTDLDYSKLLQYKYKFSTQKLLKQVIELQVKIGETMDEHQAPSNQEAELVCFSSIIKSKGIGSKMIKAFEQKLIANNIKKYYLFTDENCDYQWYDKHGYIRTNEYPIPISELDLINDGKQFYYIYRYEKELSN